MRSVVRYIVAASLLLGGCGSVPERTNGSAGASGRDGGIGGKSGNGGAATGEAAAAGTAGGGGTTTGAGGDVGTGTGGAAGAAGSAGTAGSAGAAGSAGTAGGAEASGGTGAAAAGSGGAAGSAVQPCDTTGDGLDDAVGCVTSPVYLRFVNATSTETFDVYVSGATSPVTTGLGPDQVSIVGPVQAKVLDYEFRAAGVAQAMGEVTPQDYDHFTLVAYLDPTTVAPTLATNAAPQRATGACGAEAQVDFGEFTALTPAPVIVFYATGAGANWTPVISPGLGVGQFFGSGCWNSGTPIQFGAGPANAATAADQYQAVTLGSTMTYQLLMTDDGIIEIDNLDQVTNVPKL